ncbi:MAG: hypothetical protein ACOYM8_13350 [Caulobacterales bacterium]
MIDAHALGAALLSGDGAAVRAFVGHAARIDAFGADRVGADAAVTARPNISLDASIVKGIALTAPRFASGVLQVGDSVFGVFARTVGDVLERAWLVGPVIGEVAPFLGLAAPHDPRMSQMSPAIDFDAALHPELNAAHVKDLQRLAPLVVSEAWRTERSEIAVFEAFSTETGWATLLRVQGEERVVSGRVVQVGAWAIVVQSDGATACVVDAWEPAAHRIALTPLHL